MTTFPADTPLRPVSAALALATTATIGALSFLPDWLGALLLGPLIIVAILLRDRSMAVVAGLFLIVAGFDVLPFVTWWPVQPAFALVCLAAMAWIRPSWRSEWQWLKRGRVDAPIIGLIVASVIIAGVALLAWYLVLTPDVSDLREAMFPPYPAWVLVLGGIGFAAVNAAVEEALFRGILLGALDRTLKSPIAALLLQAAAFGLMHINGFPRGAVGVGLAAIYGLMMGMLRRRSNGMLAPWLGHVATDLTIVSILAFLP